MAKKGWKGNSEGHRKAGKLGGLTTALKYGRDHFREIGKLGGKRKYDKWRDNDTNTNHARTADD